MCPFHTWSQSCWLFHFLAGEVFWCLHASSTYRGEKKEGVCPHMSTLFQVEPAFLLLGTSGSRWGGSGGSWQSKETTEGSILWLLVLGMGLTLFSLKIWEILWEKWLKLPSATMSSKNFDSVLLHSKHRKLLEHLYIEVFEYGALRIEENRSKNKQWS